MNQINKNSYLYLAQEDLRSAEGLLKIKIHSSVPALCCQALEKIFKYYIENYDNENYNKNWNSHNLRKLFDILYTMLSNTINNEDLQNYKSFLEELSPLYINTRYPGDSYTYIDLDKANYFYKGTKEIFDMMLKEIELKEKYLNEFIGKELILSEDSDKDNPFINLSFDNKKEN